MRKIIWLLLLIPILVVCKKKDKKEGPTTPFPSASGSFDQKSLLNAWAQNVIQVGYKEHYGNLESLENATTSFLSSPSGTTLDGLQAAHHLAYLSWQKVLLFEFGPAMDHTLSSNSNIYPTDKVEIEKNIAQNLTDLSAASKLYEKGLPALDYLLHHENKDSVIVFFQESANRRNYLGLVVKDLLGHTGKVKAAWESGYSTSFQNNVGTSAGSGIGLMLNSVNMQFERFVRDGKVGIPSGVRDFNGASLPDHVEALYRGNVSMELLLASLKGMELWYTGNNTVGLDDYLINLKATYNGGSLDEAIKAQFVKCNNAAMAISKPLKEAVLSDKTKVDALYKELQLLAVLFKVDVPSALGVVITYQDNDGD